MNTMNKIDCKTCQSHMADLLLDAEFADTHSDVAAHVESCSSCRTELSELRATFALLDEYTAPEPSPYFDTRLYARLREVQTEAPEGFFARLRSRFLFSSGRTFHPAVAAALAVVLAVGGGSAFFLHGTSTPSNAPATSATINDLKVLDNNQQAEQLMGSLLDQSGSEDDDPGSPAS